MAERSKHPNKDIEAVLQYAESKGWVVIKTGKSSHAWGRISCSLMSPDGCRRKSIWSTPKSPERHARELKRYVDQCPHNNE